MENYSLMTNVINITTLFLNIHLPPANTTAKSECHFPLLMPSKGNYNEVDGSTKITIDLVSEIALKMASAADIVMHYDDTSDQFVNAVSKKSNMFEIMESRDENGTKKSSNFAYKARHVVHILKRYRKNSDNLPLRKYVSSRNNCHFVILSDPRKFTLSRIINTDNTIIYVCIDQSQSAASCISQNSSENLPLNTSLLLSTEFLKKGYLVMVLEITYEYVRLFEICYYCGERSEKLTLKFESKLGHDFSQTPFLNIIIEAVDFHYKNFNGHTFRVAFTHDNIYVGCQNEVNTEINGDIFSSCSDMLGTEGLMLIEISKRMNFKYSLVNPKIHDDVGPWKNMINDVYQSKVDFAIGSITISASRLQIIDYTIKVGDDPLRIVYMVQRNIFSEGLIIVSVFTSQTWMVLLVTIVVLSALVYAAEQYIFTKQISILRCYWMVCRILIEQGVSHSERIPGRRIMFPWLFCCIIICTVYKAKLTSLLINPPKDHLTTLDELAKAGYDAYLNELDGSLVTGTLELSPDPVMQQLVKRTHINRSICNVLKDAITADIMLIEEQVPIQLAVNRKCPQIMTRAELARIRVTKDDMLPSTHAWVFRKKTPFLNNFNHYIALLYQNGIKRKWDTVYQTNTKKNHINFATGVVDSDIQPAMYGPLIVWSLGMMIGVVCFVGEVFFSICGVTKGFLCAINSS